MTLDQLIDDFATSGHTLPRVTMQWALDNWHEAGPGFVELLERYASGAERSERLRSALLIVIHLLGDKSETAAFPALCRLMMEGDVIEEILGDGITETLRGIVISTYSGDLAALQAVIEAADADEFVRAAALVAMAYLTRTGRISEREMQAYLLHLLMEMQPQSPCYVWVAWVEAVALLGYRDYARKAEQVLRRFVHPTDMTVGNFRADLRRTLGDDSGMAGFEDRGVEPFTDAIAELSGWHGFSPEYAAEQARRAVREDEADDLASLAVGAPYKNPMRHVGRNDPCPCGSGKKYKKCCLR